MAAPDSHTVTSSPLTDIFDDHDVPSSLTTCACRASPPAVCKCSPSLDAVRGRESTTKVLSSSDIGQSQPQLQPQRLTLKLTLPPQSKQRKQSDNTLRSSFPPVQTASLVAEPQHQEPPPKRKRGRPKKIDSQRAPEGGPIRPSHNAHKPPSQSTLPNTHRPNSKPLTKPGTARVKRGTVTSNPNGPTRRRRSSSNFSDTVPRRHKHPTSSSANNVQQQPHQQPHQQPYPLFVPANVLSSDDLSSSSVSLSESSESDDECESSSLSLSLSMGGDEQADRGRTHHQNSYDQQAQLERARVRRELLGHNQPSPHQQQQQHHTYNQQDHVRAHPPPPLQYTAGGGGTSSGDSETEDDERSSGSDSDDGTDSDDGDPDPNGDLNLTATRFLSSSTAAIEVDPDSESESEVDAELFFSNLIKSASSSDDDSEDGDGGNDEVMLGVEIGIEIPGAPGTGGDHNDRDNHHGDAGGNHGNGNHEVTRGWRDPAMMVREGWDGTLVFATDIGTHDRGGVLDAAFERSSSWSRERRPPSLSRPSTSYSRDTTTRAGKRTMSVSSGLPLPLDVIAELQAAAETTLLGPGLTPSMSMSLSMMDSGSALSDTEEGGTADTDADGAEMDGGETTDDELPGS
jgi:hypothetical protein